MDTAGDGLPNVIAYLVVLALFVQIGIRLLRTSGRRRRFPVFALLATIVIGVPSLLQYVWPVITTTLERNPEFTLAHGQWWRLLTALLAQDGGLAGAIFNLIVVAGVTLLGEWIWGWWLALVLFLLPSIVLNLLAILLWNASGGGSSFASDGLLMSMCGLALVTLPDVVAKVLASVTVLIGIALVAFLNDAHGVAILLGAALGVVFALPRLRTTETRPAPNGSA